MSRVKFSVKMFHNVAIVSLEIPTANFESKCSARYSAPPPPSHRQANDETVLPALHQICSLQRSLIWGNSNYASRAAWYCAFVTSSDRTAHNSWLTDDLMGGWSSLPARLATSHAVWNCCIAQEANGLLFSEFFARQSERGQYKCNKSGWKECIT